MTKRQTTSTLKIRAYKPSDLARCVKLFVKVFSQPPWEDQWPSEERAGEYLSDIVGGSWGCALGTECAGGRETNSIWMSCAWTVTYSDRASAQL